MGMCLKRFLVSMSLSGLAIRIYKVRSPVFGGNILDNGEEMAIFFTSFTFLAVLPRLFLGSTLIPVASNWAAKVTFSFRFFFSCDKLLI